MSYTTVPTAENQPAVQVAVGASPFTWQNTNPFPVVALIFGGLLSAVQLSRDGTVFQNASTGTSLIPMNMGDSLKISYTLLPSAMWVIPN